MPLKKHVEEKKYSVLKDNRYYLQDIESLLKGTEDLLFSNKLVEKLRLLEKMFIVQTVKTALCHYLVNYFLNARENMQPGKVFERLDKVYIFLENKPEILSIVMTDVAKNSSDYKMCKQDYKNIEPVFFKPSYHWVDDYKNFKSYSIFMDERFSGRTFRAIELFSRSEDTVPTIVYMKRRFALSNKEMEKIEGIRTGARSSLDVL